MDTLAHGLIAAAVCSKTGLAGGRRGPRDAKGRPRFFHWTLWAALAFGLLPDLLSIGLYIIPQWFTQGHGVWRGLPDWAFTLYNLTHSLPIALILVALCFGVWRPLALPALAWPLHILTDVFTHGRGRFLTPVFYPFSEYRFHGINWWEHPGFFYAYWLAIGLLWAAIAWRRWPRRPRNGAAAQT